MKHLIIINPKSGYIRDHIDEIENDIKSFFAGNPRMEYAIHITRWKRDASGYTLRYVSNAAEIVRVYAFGGNGTLFEVINGVLGMPNVQVAWYPLGGDNSMISAFGGAEKISAFQSMRNLSLSPVITIDTIKTGNHYMTINTLIGAEAEAFHRGERLAERSVLPRPFCYAVMAGIKALFNKPQRYHIETDSTELKGEFISLMITNIPVHGPMKDSPRFNDGYMDLFTLKRIPVRMFPYVIRDYTRGCYYKWPEYIGRCRCKKLRLSSDSVMTVSMDGELFYETALDFEIFPLSLDFVCPPGIFTDQYDVEHHEETVKAVPGGAPL